MFVSMKGKLSIVKSLLLWRRGQVLLNLSQSEVFPLEVRLFSPFLLILIFVTRSSNQIHLHYNPPPPNCSTCPGKKKQEMRASRPKPMQEKILPTHASHPRKLLHNNKNPSHTPRNRVEMGWKQRQHMKPHCYITPVAHGIPLQPIKWNLMHMNSNCYLWETTAVSHLNPDSQKRNRTLKLLIPAKQCLKPSTE